MPPVPVLLAFASTAVPLATGATGVAGAGYDGPPGLTGARLFTAWELDPWLALGVAAAAALYLWGVWRLHSRGVQWPAARSIAFLGGGLGSIVVATMGTFGVYDDTLFFMHAIQHMILAMISPVFLALGAPVTLALRALPRDGRRQLTALLHSRLARVASFPPLTWLHFIAIPFALYTTGWYELSLRNGAVHELLHVQFLLAGCMFFWPLLGLDPVPGRLSYPLRLMTAFTALPYHAVLGLTVMMQTSLIAGDYYRQLGRPWGMSLHADQSWGGGLMWASGDLIGLLIFAALFFQWQRAESRLAVREDRRLDREYAAAVRIGGGRPRRAVVPAPAVPSTGESGAAQPEEVDAEGRVRPWWETESSEIAAQLRRTRRLGR